MVLYSLLSRPNNGSPPLFPFSSTAKAITFLSDLSTYLVEGSANFMIQTEEKSAESGVKAVKRGSLVYGDKAGNTRRVDGVVRSLLPNPERTSSTRLRCIQLRMGCYSLLSEVPSPDPFATLMAYTWKDHFGDGVGA